MNETLSPTQTSILKLLSTDHEDEEIAEILCMTPHMVKAELDTIFQLTGASNRLEVVHWAVKNL